MKISFNLVTTIIILSLGSLLSGCYYDTKEELYPDNGTTVCDTVSISYATHIVPIMNAKCSLCHAGASPISGISLDSYANVKTYLDGNKETFIASITWAVDANYKMPASAKMIDCDINKITAWINSGYPNN